MSFTSRLVRTTHDISMRGRDRALFRSFGSYRPFSSQEMPSRARIVEVGPRDGLQNEKQIIPLEAKIELIRKLSLTGLKNIEAGSFVSPKWVPQMADSTDIFAYINSHEDNMNTDTVRYSALTPNVQGLEFALQQNVKEVAVFGAASEAFSLKNINCSIDESLSRFDPVCKAALDQGLKVRGYVSCVLGCPYDGPVEPSKVKDVAHKLIDMGCYEISLGDTIGVGTPGSTNDLLSYLLKDTGDSSALPADKLAVHFHDTYGQALANIYVALLHNITTIDCSVSGLGGCPYASGASGNVATEDVVYMLQGLGIDAGVDLDRLIEASVYIDEVLGRATGSKVCAAVGGKRESAKN